MRRRGGRAFAILGTLAVLLVLPSSALAAPPPNDSFAAATVLSGASASAGGTTVDATKETGEPNHGGYSGDGSVWYRWVAPTDSTVAVDTAGSYYTPVVAVYTGAAVDALEPVASATGRIRFSAVAGRTYSVALATGYYNERGAVAVNLTSGEPPWNDAFASAQFLTGEQATVATTNRWSTREPGEPQHGSYYMNGSLWYAWKAPYTGAATIDTAGSAVDTALGVYTGGSVSELVRIVANDDASSRVYTSRVAFRAEEGTTYRIALDATSYGSVRLALQLGPPPSNDFFAAPTVLAPDATVIAAGNEGAGVEPTEPSHYSYDPPRSSVWFQWTAPRTGALTLGAAANFPTIVAAYQGDRLSDLSRVRAQPQGGSPGPEQLRIAVRAGETYRFAVASRYAGDSGAFTLTLTLQDAPANDDFANAQTLSGPSADVDGTNVGATQEPGEPVHEQNYYDPSVWYTWTAPASGGVTIDMAGSALNAIVAVYTGDSVGALTRVTSNTVTAAGARQKRVFRAGAGVTYRIVVDGASAAQGAFKLALRQTPPPANDMFAAALPLEGADVTVSGENKGATGEPGEPTPGGTAGASVWYAYTASAKGVVRLSLPTRDFAAGLGVYTGTSPGALTRVTTTSSGYYNSSPTVRFQVDPGTTYRIAVDGGALPNRGSFSLRLEFFPPPPNDDFDNSIELTGSSDSETGSNVGATKQPGEPSHYYSGGASVWYRWTAPASGQATLDLTGSDFDWVTAVYTGSSFQNLLLIANADYGKVAFKVTQGTTYRVAVDGYSGASGAIKLALQVQPAPANDDFANAAELSGASGSATGTSVGATREPYEPYHAGFEGSRSVWYRWSAPASGPATIDLSGSGFDTLLAVYTGSLGSLTKIASDNDSGDGSTSKVSFEATAGTTYRVAVDGYYGAFGSIALAWKGTAPPPPDPPAEDPPPPDPPAEDPPVEDPPVEDPPVEDPPVEDPPVGDPPVEDPPVEDPPVEDPPVEDPPVEDPPAEDPPMEDPPADDPPATETTPPDETTTGTTTTATGTTTTGSQATTTTGSDTSTTTATNESPPPAAPSPSRAGDPLFVRATFARQRLGTVLKRGLVGRVSCPRADCSVEAIVTLDSASARRLGLLGASASLARATVAAGNGPAKIVIKVPASARRKLARAKSLKLTVRLTARSGPDTATDTRRLTLKR